MGAACAGLGERARLWRWGGTAVARDVPQEEQLPCAPCPCGDVWMWHSDESSCKFRVISVELFRLHLATTTVLAGPFYKFRPLDFPPPFRAPIAALPAKADGGLFGACSPARSVRVRRGRRDRTPRRACRAVRLRAPLLHRLRPTRSRAGSDLKPAPAERAVLRPASARRWQAREPQRG